MNFAKKKSFFIIMHSFFIRNTWQVKGTLPCLKQFFGNWKPFKNDEKCFLFHLKSFFRSQDI